MTHATNRPSWQNEDGTVNFADMDGDFDREIQRRERQETEDVARFKMDRDNAAAYGHTASTSALRRFKCSHCQGTGTIKVYRKGMGWDQIPELKKCWYGCVDGWTRTDPAKLELRRKQAVEKKAAKADSNRAQAQAFLESRADVALWFRNKMNNGTTANEFAESVWDALHKYGSLTPGQLGAIERQIEGDRAREQARAAAAEQARTQAAAQGIVALDLTALPSGMYAVPNGDTRLKVRVNRPKTNSRWAGFIFVDDGAAYGQRQNYGRQKMNGLYEGKIQDQLRAIMADPQGAMAAYGLLTGRCGHCGRILEDEVSVARGIGPVCAAKLGW